MWSIKFVSYKFCVIHVDMTGCGCWRSLSWWAPAWWPWFCGAPISTLWWPNVVTNGPVGCINRPQVRKGGFKKAIKNCLSKTSKTMLDWLMLHVWSQIKLPPYNFSDLQNHRRNWESSRHRTIFNFFPCVVINRTGAGPRLYTFCITTLAEARPGTVGRPTGVFRDGYFVWPLHLPETAATAIIYIHGR